MILPLSRIAVSLALVAIAGAVTWFIGPLRAGAPFLLFFAAIALSTASGGRNGGVAAILASILFSWIWILPPHGGIATDLLTMVRVIGFSGVATLIVGVIVQRGRAQQELELQRRWLEQTLRSIGDAVIATDTTGQVVFVNDVAERLTGWDAAEARGRQLGEILRIVNEGTREPVENPAARVLRDGHTVGLANHTLLISRSGAVAPIEDSAAPIRDAHGGLLGVILVFHDVSEKRDRERAIEASERRFRSVFNQQFQFMALLAPDGRLLEISDLPLQAGGITREMVVGRHFWDTVWWEGLPAMRAKWPERLQEAAQADGPVLTEDEFRTASGEVRNADAALTAVKDETGAVEFFIVQASDSTDRLRAEQARREGERRLRFLHELAEATRPLHNPAAIMETAARLVGRHLQVSRCAYAEVLADGESFTILDDYTDGCATSVGEYQLWLFGPRASADMNGGATLVIRDVDAELLPEEGAGTFNAIGIKAIICCPLVKEGRLRAMMAVHQAAPREWTADEISLVEEVVERSWAYLERARTEVALRQSEERLRLATRATSDGVWDWDLLGGDLYWNEAAALIFRGRLDELGRTTTWWEEHIHPEDRERVTRSLREALDTGATHWTAEYRLLRLDGSVGDVLDRGHLLRDEQGNATRMIGAMQDLSERYEAQRAIANSREQLRLAMQATSLGIWDFAPMTGKLRWDPRCKELFGLSPDAEVTYQTYLDGLHPDDRERADQEARAAFDPGSDGVFDIEYRTIGIEDGLERWVRAMGRAVFNEKQEATRFIGTIQDITEEKRAEEALRAAKEQAEAASRAKDSFLAALSHELRTPLTPVLMTAAALKSDERLPADVRAQLGGIQRNVELEARLIDDLLDLTRISRGRFLLRRQPCEVHAIIQLAVEIVRDEAQLKDQVLSLELAASKTMLTADPARLQQVFWNLLRNAVKFTPRGGRISIRTADREAAVLQIEVSDNGLGISPDAVDRIFEPFEQGGLENDHRYGGMGLGLTIVRAIVELHEGSVVAESAGRGRGATFKVQLPGSSERPAEATAGKADASPAAPENSAPAVETGMRLLVVEDHEPTLQILTRLLTRAGHQVVSAGDLAHARAAAATRSFDALVSDLGLPDGSGFELMAELRTAYGLCGVALSGYGMEEDLLRSKEAGFSAHLIKPVDFQQLQTALAHLDGFQPEHY